MEILRVKKMRENATIPTRATKGSAGYDLYACISQPLVLPAGGTALIPTGIAAAIGDPRIAGFVYPRSGMSTKYNVSLPNAVGVIDSDYRGEILVGLTNYSAEDFVVEPQQRIAQIVFAPVELPVLVEAEELDETDRGAGGYGSSGK